MVDELEFLAELYAGPDYRSKKRWLDREVLLGTDFSASEMKALLRKAKKRSKTLGGDEPRVVFDCSFDGPEVTIEFGRPETDEEWICRIADAEQYARIKASRYRALDPEAQERMKAGLRDRRR